MVAKVRSCAVAAVWLPNPPVDADDLSVEGLVLDLRSQDLVPGVLELQATDRDKQLAVAVVGECGG